MCVFQAGRKTRDCGRPECRHSQPRLWTAQEFADLLRVSRFTVYRMISDGQLCGIKTGRSWRIPDSAVRMHIGASDPASWPEPGSPGHDRMDEITSAVRDALAIIDRALPPRTPAPARPPAEQAELRKIAFQAVLTVLLREEQTPAGTHPEAGPAGPGTASPDAAPPGEPDAAAEDKADDTILGTPWTIGDIARMRGEGMSWTAMAARTGISRRSLSNRHSRWLRQAHPTA